MHEANIIQAAGDTHLDLDLDLDLLLRLRDLDFDLEVFFPLRLRDLCVKQCAQCVMYNNICKTQHFDQNVTHCQSGSEFDQDKSIKYLDLDFESFLLDLERDLDLRDLDLDLRERDLCFEMLSFHKVSVKTNQSLVLASCASSSKLCNHKWQEHGVRQKKCFLVDLFLKLADDDLYRVVFLTGPP